jgi:hypothetical protein
MMSLLIKIAVLLGGSALFLWLSRRTSVAKKGDRFVGREELTLEEIYDRFFRDKNLEKSAFEKNWILVAETLHCPAGKMRPTDRFDDELKPAYSFELDNDDLEHEAIDLLSQKKRHSAMSVRDVLKRLGQIETLNDFILMMGASDCD